MSYRRILLPVSGHDSDVRMMSSAAKLADHMKAHLDVVFVRPDPATFAPYYLGATDIGLQLRADLTKAQREVWDKIEQKVHQRFAEFCKQIAITETEDLRGPGAATARLSDLTAKPETLLPRLARTCDLTLLPLPYGKDAGFSPAVAENTLIHSGRPVLFLPKELESTNLETAGIAWNSSREAAQAIAESLPLIKLADQIEILSIDETQEGQAKADELVDYFTCLGIPATAESIKSDYEGTGIRLLEEAEKRKWDLLVMGGYGHARWQQHIFAGTTRQVLEHAKIPVVQAH